MIKAKLIIFDDKTGQEFYNKTIGPALCIDSVIEYPEVAVRKYVFDFKGGIVFGHRGVWRNHPVLGKIEYISMEKT